mgnify:CR=1 FL=1
MEVLLHRITATRGRELASVAALFLLLALLTTWPLVTAPAMHSVSDRANNDVFLNQYLIFWGAHAIVEEPGNLYDTNMFYPSRYGFAYADMLLTDSLLLYPVIRAFYDPTLTYNVLLWLAMVIGGTGMYVLCRLLVGSRVAALVAGILFVANPTHFVRYKQPQFFNDGLLPWFLAAMLIWLASCGLWRRGMDLNTRLADREAGADVGGLGSTRRSLAWAAGAALLFCLHSQTGSHNAIFGLLIGGGLTAYYAAPLLAARWRSGSWPDSTRRFLSGAGVMALLGVLILAPLFYPYFRVGQYLESERFGEATEAANQLAAGSASAVELLTTSSHFYNWVNSRFGWPSDYLGGPGPHSDLFPGVILLFLALLSLLPDRTARLPRSAQRMCAGALDALLLLSALAAWATWQHGWRRLGPGFGAFPTVWVWPVVAALTLAARARWLRQEPHGLVAAYRALSYNRDLRFWLGVTVLCFLAALGPAFGLYELVRLVPAANLIRVPSRFVLPMAMALSVMAAWGVARLLAGSARHRRGPIVLSIAMVFFAMEASFAPLPTVPTPYPADPAALWLGQQPGDFAVMEIPIDPGPTQATRQMLQSIHHWKKLVIGYSGAAPPGYEERMQRLAAGFPGQAALDELATLDVRYLVVLEKRIFGELLDAIRAEPRLREVQRFGDTSIWELR